MESTNKNHPPDEPAGERRTGKTVRDLREEFRADFARAVAAGDDADCLSPEEILAFQSGAKLDEIATRHIANCRFCHALSRAIEVDPGLKQEFLEAAAKTRRSKEPEFVYRTRFDWRLQAAILTSMSAIAMVWLVVPRTSVPSSQIIAVRVNKRVDTGHVEIALTGPSSEPTTRVIAVQGSQVTVRDVAPQVATAVVLSKAKITMPIEASTSLAEAETKADHMVTKWLASAVNDNDKSIEAIIESFKSPDAVYDAANKGFRLSLPGNTFAWLPNAALIEGLNVNEALIKVSGSEASLSRPDGSVLSVKLIAPGFRSPALKIGDEPSKGAVYR